MNKKEIKNILISMRTPENETLVNYLLGEIDMRDETTIEQAAEKLGNNEENIRNFFMKKIAERTTDQKEEKYPINDMFTYGISGNCIHLHLPTDLHDSIAKRGISKTIALVNLHLLDAIVKIKDLKDNGFSRLKDADSIYMISPAVIKREMAFLEGLDFTTHSYSKRQLSDDEFLCKNPEAILAVNIFGRDKNVGTASIRFDVINSKEWQEKKNKTMEDLKSRIKTTEDNKLEKDRILMSKILGHLL